MQWNSVRNLMCVGRYGISGKFVGINYALLPNRQWNKKQKHKKQPWSNVECFAFGGATVRFASLETSFHAANHTIPPPPSYEGYPLCPKDKNRSPFHGEKPLITTWFLDCINSPKRFFMVGTRYFESTEKVKPTFRLKVNNGEIVVLPFFFCLS